MPTLIASKILKLKQILMRMQANLSIKEKARPKFKSGHQIRMDRKMDVLLKMVLQEKVLNNNQLFRSTHL